jgi:hypothetical protein
MNVVPLHILKIMDTLFPVINQLNPTVSRRLYEKTISAFSAFSFGPVYLTTLLATIFL